MVVIDKIGVYHKLRANFWQRTYVSELLISLLSLITASPNPDSVPPASVKPKNETRITLRKPGLNQRRMLERFLEIPRNASIVCRVP
jgi:hypothetical protein